MRTFNLYLAGANQRPLDPRRPYVTQIGRFDPSKVRVLPFVSPIE